MAKGSSILGVAADQPVLPLRVADLLRLCRIEAADFHVFLASIGVADLGALRHRTKLQRARDKKAIRRWLTRVPPSAQVELLSCLYQPPAQSREKPKKHADKFYQSDEWKRLRFRALAKHRRCLLCGAGPDEGAILNVDHIKPVRERPDLALDESNLQVLCGSCNWGKGNRTADFRPPP